MSQIFRRYYAPRRAMKRKHPFLIIALCLLLIGGGVFLFLNRNGDRAAKPTPSTSESPAQESTAPSPTTSTPASTPTPSAEPTPSVSASPSPSVTPTLEPTPTQPEKKTEIPWNLTLVNNTHALPQDFVPELSKLPNGLEFDTRAKDALMEMVNACKAEGLQPVIGSAYRSIERQIYLHERKIKFYLNDGLSYDEAYAAASRVVAIPGCSEHNLGLAVDLCSLNNQNLDESQLDTPEQQWFMEHCHEYGFILRYPLDKTELTGIIFEPWHYRYVGVEAAKEITENGLCLEEYMELNYVID